MPALHFIRLLPYQWVSVTMETSEFLHITGEPACQQPWGWGWWGEAEGSLQPKVWLALRGTMGNVWIPSSAPEVPGPLLTSPSSLGVFSALWASAPTPTAVYWAAVWPSRDGVTVKLDLWWDASSIHSCRHVGKSYSGALAL